MEALKLFTAGLLALVVGLLLGWCLRADGADLQKAAAYWEESRWTPQRK